MIRVTVTAHVAAPTSRVLALYADPTGWARLFPVLGAEIRLKGALRLAEPIAAPLVRARMRRWVVEPVRRAAETTRAG